MKDEIKRSNKSLFHRANVRPLAKNNDYIINYHIIGWLTLIIYWDYFYTIFNNNIFV